VVDRPYEVIVDKKVPKVKYVEKVRQVPGNVIHVPQPYSVKQTVEVNRYTDRKRPIVVAQTVKPYIVEGAGVVDIDVFEYEPECIPVDIHVFKAVQAKVQAGVVVENSNKVITIPAAQYNTVLQQLNSHLPQQEIQKLPYHQENGQTMFLSERVTYSEPQVDIVSIEGFDHANAVTQHIDHASRRVVPVPGVTDEYGNLLPQHQAHVNGAYPTSAYPTMATSAPFITNARQTSTTTRPF
jgi:hypothetical protein